MSLLKLNKSPKLSMVNQLKVNKDWTYYEMGPYNYIKYPELLKLVQNYSKGLLELGLLPDQQSKLMVLRYFT